jgi:hypothetical protein
MISAPVQRYYRRYVDRRPRAVGDAAGLHLQAVSHGRLTGG